MLRRQLLELPGLWRELKTAEVKLTRLGERSTGHGSGGERGLPFNEQAGVHARRIAEDLADLAAGVQPGPRPTHPAVACSILLTHLARLTAREDAAHVALLVGELHSRAVRLVDIPQVRQRFEVGPCPETTTTDGRVEHCPGDVWAWIPTDEDLRPVLQCNTCEARWSAEQWARVGGRIQAERARRTRVQAMARAIMRGGAA